LHFPEDPRNKNFSHDRSGKITIDCYSNSDPLLIISSDVKNLMIFLLLIALAGFVYHDQQQAADLLKAQQDNAALTQQLSDRGTNRSSQPLQTSSSGPWSLKSSSLDRGPYKDVTQ
jgi:hypothetical protein